MMQFETEPTPFRDAIQALRREPWHTAGAFVFITALCGLILSGWAGRLAGAAAVIVEALPPHF